LTGKKFSKLFLFSFEVWHATRFPFLENLLWAIQPIIASPIMSKKTEKFIVYFDFEEDEIVNTAELFFGQNWT